MDNKTNAQPQQWQGYNITPQDGDTYQVFTPRGEMLGTANSVDEAKQLIENHQRVGV